MAAIATAVVASVVATGVSVIANKDAAEEQQGLQAASDFEARQTATRRRVRERRIKEARLRQSAANTGVGGSSGESGAISSIASQFATGTSASVFAQKQGEAMGEIKTDLAKSSAISGIISAGAGLASAYGQYKTPKPKEE